MFDSLSEKLQETLSGVRGRGALTEEDITRAMREIRLALLEADVNFKVVKQFTSAVKERCLGAEVQRQLNPGQQVVKIVNEELTKLMGGASAGLSFSPRPPTVILMAGLQGSGKTTATAKLARFLREEHGSSVGVAACDVYRPAAVEQLIKVGGQAGATVYERGTDADPVEIAAWARDQAERDGKDVLIVDTAGRLHIDEALMAELTKIKQTVRPTDVLLVVDAMTGQDAVNVAEQFAEAAQFDGVILSKLDGDARGGAALSVKAVTGKPILFASTGEKLENFERFHPDRMAQRILGMGDVLSFIEKAEKAGRRGGRQGARAQAPEERVHARGLPRPAQEDPQDGPADLAARDDARARRPAALEDERRRARARPRRGDHPLDDAVGAAAPRVDQGLAPPPHREGLGHERPAGQPAGQAVRGDAQADARPLPGQDARSRRPDAPALRRCGRRPWLEPANVNGGWVGEAVAASFVDLGHARHAAIDETRVRREFRPSRPTQAPPRSTKLARTHPYPASR